LRWGPISTRIHTKRIERAIHEALAPTPERLAELKRLASLPDEAIDTSDAPELTKAELAEMMRGHFYRPIKRQVTARLDADVLAWLKLGGQGYQTRMNAILRSVMLKEIKG
jgi:uncharacterized protein (DUF4415 family)